MAETLSEQVAELERERDAHKARAESWKKSSDEWMHLHAMECHKRNAAESREKQARVEGARGAAETLIEFVRTWRGFDVDVAGDCGPSTGNVLLRQMRKFRDREYPATGEEPTRRSRRCPACERHVAVHAEDCPHRPAPPAVTEPQKRVVAGWQSEETYNGDTDVWYYAMCEDGSVWGRPAWNSDKPWELQAPALAARPTASGEG